MPNSPHDTLVDPYTKSIFSTSDSTKPTLTVLSGSEVGRVFALDEGPSIIGRSASVAVHIPHESISRQHCEVLVSTDGSATLRDLGSTNGTRIDASNIADRHVPLTGGERIRLSKAVTLKFAYQDGLERAAQQDLYHSAVRDPLTGVHNKRFFLERLTHEVAFANRHSSPLALLIFDLDHFKRVNDTHGHPTGDAVLIDVAKRVHNSLRAEDIFARYGGEEFVVLMRGTPEEEAINVAERIRAAVSFQPFRYESISLKTSVSIGLAMYDAELSPSASALIALADARLYTAKSLGRDRVVSQ
jgi:diguanylate cyclase (GGDEF)-like protein